MKVAAYQAPLAQCRDFGALAPIREQIDRCESLGVDILCCPEGVLGGLADYIDEPTSIGINVGAGELDDVLAPLASDTVTTILGFTEIDGVGRLFNSAAIFERGSVVGVYRKLHPAINRSVYQAGREMPVFTVGVLTFGIIICRDSTFAEPARVMASRGAAALFVPTNNALPIARARAGLNDEARTCDIELSLDHGISVIRADVVGESDGLLAHGSSGIVDQNGVVVSAALRPEPQLLIAEINGGQSRFSSNYCEVDAFER